MWAPFEGSGSTQDLLELAQKCESAGDYTCAQNYYNQLPAGTLQDQKLCALAVSQAKFTLPTLINVLTKGDKGALISVANALIPWSAASEAAAAAAVTACQKFANDSDAGDAGPLFLAVAYVAQCGTLIAKTAQYLGTDDDTSKDCTPGSSNMVLNTSGDGSIVAADIAQSSTYQASSANPGMCAKDAVTCANDIVNAANVLQSGSATLTDVLNTLNNVPSQVKNVIEAPVVRCGLSEILTGTTCTLH